MLLNNVDPEKWYSVTEVSEIMGPSPDRIRDRIYGGYLQAFIGPKTAKKRGRVYRWALIKGGGIIRFVSAQMTVLQPGKKLRMRAA